MKLIFNLFRNVGNVCMKCGGKAPQFRMRRSKLNRWTHPVRVIMSHNTDADAPNDVQHTHRRQHWDQRETRHIHTLIVRNVGTNKSPLVWKKYRSKQWHVWNAHFALNETTISCTHSHTYTRVLHRDQQWNQRTRNAQNPTKRVHDTVLWIGIQIQCQQ